jgi:hypothetical protein
MSNNLGNYPAPPDIPSIMSLHKEKSTKESSKNDIFNIVLNKIVQKIVYTNRHTDQTYVIFEIPQILIGYPQYDMKSCILFVMNRLSANGYIVEFVQPFYLYIDWGKSSFENSQNIVKHQMMNMNVSSKHKDKLRAHTKQIINKFPNTSQIEFVYEDDLKHKKRLKKNKKK